MSVDLGRSRRWYNPAKIGRQVAGPETFDAGLLDLRAFSLVVDLGSITAAAKALGETKGSVSRRIARLEHGLAVGLFAAPAYPRKHGPVRKPDDLHAHRLLTARATRGHATRGHATLVLATRDGREESRIRERSADLFLVHQGTRFLPAKTRAFRDYVLEAFGVRGRRASST